MLPTSRVEARALGLNRYLPGKACAKGHVAPRRTHNGECVVCARELQAARRAMYPERFKALRKAWYQKNRDHAAAYSRAYVAANKEKTRAACWKYLGLPTPTRSMPELCECCGRPPRGKGCLHLDHDHTTGCFRGWLCFDCNTSIGKLGDSVPGLMRGVAYLKRAEQ